MTTDIRKHCCELYQIILTFRKKISSVTIELTPNFSPTETEYSLHIGIDFIEGFGGLDVTEANLISQASSYYQKDGKRNLVSTSPIRYKFGDEKDSLKSLKNLNNAYLSDTKFLVELVNLTVPSVKITVFSTDKLPEFNYMENFWSDIDFSEAAYRHWYGTRFDDDVTDFSRLISLSNEFRTKQFDKCQKISNWLLAKGSIVSVSLIRQIVVNHQIPFQAVIKRKVISELLIDAVALKKTIQGSVDLSPLVISIITEAIDHFTLDKKNSETRISKFLDELPLKADDFIYIENGDEGVQVGKVTSVDVSDQTIWVDYCNIKNDLQAGKKTYTCTIDEINKIVTMTQYLSEVPPGGWKRLIQLTRLLKKQKKFKVSRKMVLPI